ncbi:hypothetical protein HOP52_04155 [Halomonas campisalis]|uniref:Uncharacterized protein n=1 Tax=Billgrantia campisalis TaxID=74661 RepID=A0ABS9P5A1_9GAMM|nr:hypothetical protein [Halomonas campisalis]MCG6656971.1 hypothetical protein [Halomonas campisalis]MDR5862159.1 hypothetical protein [Halomonas campisalis]
MRFLFAKQGEFHAPVVHYRRLDELGVIQIDNPPVNALGQAVRAAITLSTSAEGAEACLLAPGSHCPADGALRVALAAPETADRADEAELLLVVPEGSRCVELVDLGTGPQRQQAVAEMLKALSRPWA